MRCVWVFVILFWGCQPARNTIRIKGSDTEVNLAVQLAEAFHKEHQDILVSISGGGSGLGIASLLNGTADMANSSRSINDEEKALFKKKNIELDSFIFAQDAIAFVVHFQNPIDSISTGDLSKILNGQIKNWSALAGYNLPVNIYGRQSNSGTHSYIQHALDIRFSPQAKQMNGNAQILEGIKADASAIGYVGAGYVMQQIDRKIKILRIYTGSEAAVSPLDEAKIKSGAYFFQRPLYQYFRKSDAIKVQPFLAFEKSGTGAGIIRNSGYYLTGTL